MDAKQEFSIKTIPPTAYVFSRHMVLGKGTFGEVYLGFDQQNKIPVAVKMIPLDKLYQSHANQDALAQKLTTEMINMQIAKSQYLVKLIGPQKSSKNLYLVCEYCNGKSLKDYLEKKGTLSQAEAIHFFKQILKGFQCLYDKKIVHRDLKPANLLMHNFKIKIGDFGFSKAIDMHQQLLLSMVGSPLYMSPQILNQTPYTQKTDIWSLGIILYEMLFGEAPWKVQSIPDIKEKVKQKPEFSKSSHISAETKQTLMRMLEYEQKNRIGWQQLFKIYLHQKSEQMQEQAMQGFQKSLTDCLQHFGTSLSIQNQQHIISILQRNHHNYTQPTAKCQNAIQFFRTVRELQKRDQHLQKIFRILMSSRNKVSYLMKLFVEVYDYLEQDKKMKNGYTLTLAYAFVIIKYCLAVMTELLNCNISDQQNFNMFQNSSLSHNIKELLTLDANMILSLYMQFMEKYYLPKIQASKETNIKKQINHNLQHLYSIQSSSIKILGFWVKNYGRLFFNFIKSLDTITQLQYIISRMIYQFDKSQKTHIFQISGIKANTNKKVQAWRYDKKWANKIREIHEYEIETISSFISKEVKWNPLSQYDLSFLGGQK